VHFDKLVHIMTLRQRAEHWASCLNHYMRLGGCPNAVRYCEEQLIEIQAQLRLAAA